MRIAPPGAQGGVVFGTTQWGVLVWRAQVKLVGEFYFVILGGRAAPEYDIVPVQDHLQFSAVACRALPPAEVAQRLPCENGYSQSVVIAKQGRPEPLLHAAARLGFKGMTGHFMQKMLVHLAVCDDRTARALPEASKAKRLVEFVFPGSSQAFIDECLACRAKAPLVDSVLTADGALDKLEHSLSDDDPDEIKQSVEHIRSRPKGGRGNKAKSPVPAPPIAPGGPQVVAAVSVRPLRTLVYKDEWNLADAKALLPVVPKVSLGKDTRRFFRWSGYYPRASAPYNVTKSWGPCTGMTQQNA